MVDGARSTRFKVCKIFRSEIGALRYLLSDFVFHLPGGSSNLFVWDQVWMKVNSSVQNQVNRDVHFTELGNK